MKTVLKLGSEAVSEYLCAYFLLKCILPTLSPKCVLCSQQACAIWTEIYCMSYQHSSHSTSYLSLSCINSNCMTCKLCEIKDTHFGGFKVSQKSVTVVDSLPHAPLSEVT